MPFVWSIGTIVGPCIGGTFADPHETWPNVFPQGSIFVSFPYLLPNLICAALLFISIILGYFLLEETHTTLDPRILPAETFVSEETPLRETSDALKRPAVDVRAATYGTFQDLCPRAADLLQEPEKAVQYDIFSNKRIMAVVIALGIYTFHAMCFDHLMPIFFEDDRVELSTSLRIPDMLYFPGGLGLSMNAVGVVMAINGVIALFIQAVIFPYAAVKVGVFRLFLIVTVLHPIACLLMPYLIWVPEPLLYPAMYLCLSIRDMFNIIVYPLLLILVKEATPTPAILGKVNGFAASAGAGCRMLAPPVAGFLYTVGSKMDCTALAWWGSALFALVGSVQCFSVERVKAVGRHADEVESLVSRPKSPMNVTAIACEESEDYWESRGSINVGLDPVVGEESGTMDEEPACMKDGRMASGA